MHGVGFKLHFSAGETRGAKPNFLCEVDGFALPDITDLKVHLPLDDIAKVNIEMFAHQPMDLEFPADVVVKIVAVDGMVIRELKDDKVIYRIIRQERLPETS